MANRDKHDIAVTVLLGLFLYGFNFLLCIPLFPGPVGTTHYDHCMDLGFGPSVLHHAEEIPPDEQHILWVFERRLSAQIVDAFKVRVATVITAHGIMLVNMFASSPKDILEWKHDENEHLGAAISFGTTVVAYGTVAYYVGWGIAQLEVINDADGPLAYINYDGETIAYFPAGTTCQDDLGYFEDGPIPKLGSIALAVLVILQLTTAVSLGASFFCSPGRPEENPKQKRESEPSSDSG